MGEPSVSRTTEHLTRLAVEIAAEMELEVLSVKVSGGGGHRIVRLDVDRAGPVGVNLADCENLSVAIGGAIEDTALFGAPYSLEVSSPGIDRPIQTDDDARRNTGRRVVVETRLPLSGKTRFHGVLAGVSGSNWIVRGEDGTEWAVPSEMVIRACQDCRF